MDFLRSSANENHSRKTSSYGSLDRSWARRARSGSNSKKRPDLLNIDFSLERERPVSPANLDAANRVAHEDARPRYKLIYQHVILITPKAFCSKHIDFRSNTLDFLLVYWILTLFGLYFDFYYFSKRQFSVLEQAPKIHFRTLLSLSINLLYFVCFG